MKRIKAYSLVELVLAIGIFAGLVSYVVFFSVNSLSSLNDYKFRVKADTTRDLIFEQVSTLKRYSWQLVIDNVKNTPMHINSNNGVYQIQDGTLTVDGLIYSFTISNVSRNAQGDIVTSGGTVDPHTFKVEITFNWDDLLGRPKSYVTAFYVSDWNTYRWIQTTQADFNAGSRSNTIITNNQGGEVQLSSVIYSDWCKPQNTLTSFDLPGQGVASTISASPSVAYLGTGENASGLSFVRANINHVPTPPTATIPGTFDGYKTNDSFGSGDYAYLATDTNSKEVVIIDIAGSTFSEVGYFDSPGNTNANTVYVTGNIGIVGIGTNVYLFSLSSNTGSRAQIGSAIPIGGTVTGLYVNGNYVYVANSSTSQLKIIDISTPASASIVGSATVDGNGGTSVYASTNRAYLTTSVSASTNELFIINLDSNTGVRPIISSIDLGGMSPKSVTMVASNRVIAVGTSGYEYQVFDTTNEAAFTRCGQLNVDTGVNDSVGVTIAGGDTYSYIVTGDSSGELKVIKGGEGGGDEFGNGYISTGTYTSDILNTQSSNAVFHYVSLDFFKPANTNLRFQVRTSNDSAMSGSSFVGPDGTSSAYFDASNSNILPNSLDGYRYFQIRFTFNSDTISTPVLNSFTLNYGK